MENKGKMNSGKVVSFEDAKKHRSAEIAEEFERTPEEQARLEAIVAKREIVKEQTVEEYVPADGKDPVHDYTRDVLSSDYNPDLGRMPEELFRQRLRQRQEDACPGLSKEERHLNEIEYRKHMLGIPADRERVKAHGKSIHATIENCMEIFQRDMAQGKAYTKEFHWGGK